jgi:hypothetical protein
MVDSIRMRMDPMLIVGSKWKAERSDTRADAPASRVIRSPIMCGQCSGAWISLSVSGLCLRCDVWCVVLQQRQ